MRLLKIPLLAAAAIVVVGILFFGGNFTSYVRTSAKSVQNAVQDAVPIEFELKRARDLIEAILPQLQAQVRLIAEEEVQIARLEEDIEQGVAQMKSERASLVALREKADTTFVSVSVGKNKLSREQCIDQLHSRFERFKQREQALESKRRLLEGRQKSLSAALAMLETTKDRKVQLQQKVEALAAENRLVSASRIEAGRSIDGSSLSQADELLSEIQTRLDVAQRVLTYEQDLETIVLDDVSESSWIDEDQVLSEIDAHLQGDSPDAEDVALVPAR